MALSVSLPALRASLIKMNEADAIDLSDWEEADRLVRWDLDHIFANELFDIASSIKGMIDDKAFENWTEGEAFVKDVLG